MQMRNRTRVRRRIAVVKVASTHWPAGHSAFDEKRAALAFRNPGSVHAATIRFRSVMVVRLYCILKVFGSIPPPAGFGRHHFKTMRP